MALWILATKLYGYFYRVRKYKTLSPTKQRTRRTTELHKRKRIKFLAKNNKCLNCGSPHNLTIDHIVPKNLGGSRGKQSNWQVLCARCNNLKGGVYIKRYKPIATKKQK